MAKRRNLDAAASVSDAETDDEEAVGAMLDKDVSIGCGPACGGRVARRASAGAQRCKAVESGLAVHTGGAKQTSRQQEALKIVQGHQKQQEQQGGTGDNRLTLPLFPPKLSHPPTSLSLPLDPSPFSPLSHHRLAFATLSTFYLAPLLLTLEHFPPPLALSLSP